MPDFKFKTIVLIYSLLQLFFNLSFFPVQNELELRGFIQGRPSNVAMQVACLSNQTLTAEFMYGKGDETQDQYFQTKLRFQIQHSLFRYT